jgi:hypothetical protein
MHVHRPRNHIVVAIFIRNAPRRHLSGVRRRAWFAGSRGGRCGRARRRECVIAGICTDAWFAGSRGGRMGGGQAHGRRLMVQQAGHSEGSSSRTLVVVWGCWAVIGCWAVLLYFGATRGLQLLNHCKWSMGSPKGSPSDTGNTLAQQLLTQKGAKYELSQAALVTTKAPDTHPVTHTAVKELTQRLLVSHPPSSPHQCKPPPQRRPPEGCHT